MNSRYPPRHGPQDFRFELESAPDTVGVVRNPDGSPAAGVQIAVARKGHQVSVNNSVRIEDHPSIRTDTDGRFRFGPQDGRFWLLVVSPGGWNFVETSDADFVDDAPPFEFALRPFAVVEGELPGYADANPPTLSPGLGIELGGEMPLIMWHVEADAWDAGRFRFDRVPDTAGRTDRLSVSFYDGSHEMLDVTARLEPGETTALTFGTATLTGRAAAGDGWHFAPVSLVPVSAITAGDSPADRAEANALFGQINHARLSGDGAFTFTHLPPGEYDYTIAVYAGGDYATNVGGRVTVGEGSNDLGEIPVSAYPPPEVGAPAPQALGLDFDDQPITTEALRGKFVVGVMWYSRFSRIDLHRDALDRLADAFVDDDRVVLLSLNIDRSTASRVPVRPGTLDHPAWTPAYIPYASPDLPRRLGDPANTPRLFILTPEGTFAAVDVDLDEAADTLKRLLERE